MQNLLSLLNSNFTSRLEEIVRRDMIGIGNSDMTRFLEEVLRSYLQGSRDVREIVNMGLLKIRLFSKFNEVRVNNSIYEDMQRTLQNIPEDELKKIFVYYFIQNRQREKK